MELWIGSQVLYEDFQLIILKSVFIPFPIRDQWKHCCLFWVKGSHLKGGYLPDTLQDNEAPVFPSPILHGLDLYPPGFFPVPLFWPEGYRNLRPWKGLVSTGNLPKANSQCKLDTVTDKMWVTQSMVSGNSPLKM